MAAKIKSHPRHVASTSHKHRPRNVSSKAFEQVYWPFIPVFFAIVILLTAGAKTGSLASMIRHPASRVLAYATSEDANQALGWTNVERAQNGEPTLALDSELTAAAESKAHDMANRDYWSHNTPDGSPPWTFVTATGYAYGKLGENLATGFTDEESAVKAWMASPAHRENILDPAYSQVGFGFANVPDYKAVGGGPMTIIVAFYGQPAGVVPLSSTQPPVSTGLAPSTDNPGLGKTLASQTSRSVLAFDGRQVVQWAPVAVIIGLLAVSAILAGKHFRQIRRAILTSEKFVWDHRWFDLGLLIVAVLLLALAQTAGFIQ